jgi:hypothetical protein
MGSLDVAPRGGTPLRKIFSMCSGRDLRDEDEDGDDDVYEAPTHNNERGEDLTPSVSNRGTPRLTQTTLSPTLYPIFLFHNPNDE